MMQHPTPSQRMAMEARQDILVSAAAGSGKTAVMVERAVQIIKEGVDVRNLLMVTFTNAAAAQMKRRIRKALLQESERTGSKRLRRQATLLRTADVCTLHAFCIRLCKKYFHLVDIDPMFSLMNTVETKLLHRAAMDELMDEAYTRADPLFLDMVWALCDNQEAKLRDKIEKTYEYARTSPDPQAFLQLAQDRYAQPDDAAYRAILEEQEKKVKQTADLFETLQQTLEEQDRPDWHDKLQKLITAYAEMQAALRKGMSPENVNRIAQIKLPNFNLPKGFDEALKESLRDLLEEARANIKALVSHEVWTNQALYQERDAKMAPYVDLFCRMVADFGVRLDAQKRAKGVLDFADCEHHALRILQNPDVLEQMHAQYAYVFVDEYQDTNDMQEEIIKRVAKPGALFCVGDVKQSIYRFRHAEPRIFQNRYQEYSQREDCLCVDLNTNFRSAQRVIDGINAVFSRCMRSACGGVNYDEAQRLHAGRQAMGALPELHVILSDREDEEEGETLQAVEAEAAVCAERIQALLEETFEDNGQLRKFTYDDIAVLMRSVQNKGEAFVEALRSHGIPAAGNFSENGIPETVMPVVFALRVINNHADEFALLGVMRSVIGGFSAPELADIRLYAKQVPFYEAVRAYANVDAKTKSFVNMLQSWRERAFLQTALETIEMVLDTSHIKAAYAAMRYGETGVVNLEKLCEKARNYCACTDGSLLGFLELLETDSEFKGNQSIAQQQNGCVRVMSVHASKGLEFPAVILAFTGARMRNMRADDERLDKRWGIGVPYRDLAHNVQADGGLYLAITQVMAQEAMSEEMRILYVALTRAQDRLIVTALLSEKAWEQSKRCRPDCVKRLVDWLAPVQAGWQIWKHAMPRVMPLEETMQAPLDGDGDYTWVKQRMEWNYPHADAVRLPSKVAASQIGKTTAIQSIRPPIFIEQQALDAAARGTLAHKALLHLCLESADTLEQVNAQLDEFMGHGLFTPEERRAIDSRMLLRFTQSSICRRLQRAQNVMRELPFNLLVKASDIGLVGEEELLVQGVVDLAFLEDGEWVIIDYKTDFDTDENHLRSLYHTQVAIYRRALQAITKRPVRESILFLLRTGQTLRID